MAEGFAAIASAWLDPSLLLLTALGSAAGIYIGAIPGLSVTMAVSILISFTFSWEVNQALALMGGIYMGGVYGGARSAILLNIPGGPSSIASAFDGYPLAQRGEAGAALGLATVASVIGGFVGIAVLALAAPQVAAFALLFQPRDYLLVALLGILLVGSLSGQSQTKGIFAGALGLLIGTVGLDPLTAEERFTFGIVELWGGISPIVVMIGLFGVAEALVQLHHLEVPAIRQQASRIIPAWGLVRRFLPLSLQSSGVGVVVGALPGTGGDIAALLAYDQAKRSCRRPSRPFGQGAYEGLVAPEAANNAAVGGAYIPMLTLGIPGDAVTAVIIGALFIHGLKPGPLLMVESPQLFWFIVGNLLLANLFILLWGLTGVRFFTQVVRCPKGILLPLIVVFSVVGAYAINNSIAEVYWMLAFGVLGYLMKRFHYPVGPVVLGVILSTLMDENWRRAVIAERESLGDLLLNALTSPLSLALALMIAAVLLGQSPLWAWLKRRLWP
ncbi:MAG: tripartite tricarboxylate transporter permease [Candidatus Competibacterales bacterium]